MKVYLVQHAVAFKKEENPERPITEKGRADIKKTATFLGKSLQTNATQIFHSSKLRAAETAAILEAAIATAAEPAIDDDLKAKADPKAWEKRLTTLEGDQVLVGHLPHLQKLASLLLTGDPDSKMVEFTNAGIVCLQNENGNKQKWVLLWAVRPEFF
ncbi:MAG: phosphohistidine phosphatase SixA [Lentisphaeria bacterium]